MPTWLQNYLQYSGYGNGGPVQNPSWMRPPTTATSGATWPFYPPGMKPSGGTALVPYQPKPVVPSQAGSYPPPAVTGQPGSYPPPATLDQPGSYRPNFTMPGYQPGGASAPAAGGAGGLPVPTGQGGQPPSASQSAGVLGALRALLSAAGIGTGTLAGGMLLGSTTPAGDKNDTLNGNAGNNPNFYKTDPEADAYMRSSLPPAYTVYGGNGQGAPNQTISGFLNPPAGVPLPRPRPQASAGDQAPQGAAAPQGSALSTLMQLLQRNGNMAPNMGIGSQS